MAQRTFANPDKPIDFGELMFLTECWLERTRTLGSPIRGRDQYEDRRRQMTTALRDLRLRLEIASQIPGGKFPVLIESINRVLNSVVKALDEWPMPYECY